MIALFFVLLSLAEAQQQCAPGSSNLFAMAPSASAVVSNVACMGQMNGAAATAVQVGRLCDTCAGGCETNTRLCFRTTPLVFSFQFRVPVRFDAAIAWVTLRALGRITALTIGGQELLGQQTFAPGAKVLNNDFYTVVRTPAASAAITSLQVQFFSLADQAAISRLLICGAIAPTPVPGAPPPSQVTTIAASPAPAANSPSDVLTIFVPPGESPSDDLALPLSVIIGISAAGALCVLFVCFAVLLIARARRSARREANMTFGNDATPSRERPPQRSPGYSPSNLFERFRRTPVPPPDDDSPNHYITMQPVPPHYKTMEMEQSKRPEDTKGSYDHVPDVDQGYGYSSEGPKVTTDVFPEHTDNYDIAAEAPYSTPADKPRF